MAKRILYVEDHLNNMLLVKRIVMAEGHQFLSAVDGEKGWEMILEENPDLIFIDLRLPGQIDGFELLRRVKSDPIRKNIPAILLTAYGHTDVELRAKAAGCNGFLHKPADIRQIRSIIREYLNKPERVPNGRPQRQNQLEMIGAD
jgi:two-component system cell cycle response regulator DivK